MSGTLYIVATPIGNLADLSTRARAVLQRADLIAVEDTRHSGRLLQEIGSRAALLSCHEHNEAQRTKVILARVQQGDTVALISDAGTPLISDPGFVLVREAHRRGLKVVPVPGPSALIAALSCAGLATDRFVFEGFLPAKTGARQQRLAELASETRTLVFYEAPHRILACAGDLCDIFGAAREATLARELTKTYETLVHGTLQSLRDLLQQDENQQKGEIVLVVAGAARREQALDAAAEHTLRILLEDLPLKQAAALAARLTGLKKNLLYDVALGWQSGKV
jgi:16S rRNA (cytidine1402-2'-O)-methyltransferase